MSGGALESSPLVRLRISQQGIVDDEILIGDNDNSEQLAIDFTQKHDLPADVVSRLTSQIQQFREKVASGEIEVDFANSNSSSPEGGMNQRMGLVSEEAGVGGRQSSSEAAYARAQANWNMSGAATAIGAGQAGYGGHNKGGGGDMQFQQSAANTMHISNSGRSTVGAQQQNQRRSSPGRQQKQAAFNRLYEDAAKTRERTEALRRRAEVEYADNVQRTSFIATRRPSSAGTLGSSRGRAISPTSPGRPASAEAEAAQLTEIYDRQQRWAAKRQANLDQQRQDKAAAQEAAEKKENTKQPMLATAASRQLSNRHASVDELFEALYANKDIYARRAQEAQRSVSQDLDEAAYGVPRISKKSDAMARRRGRPSSAGSTTTSQSPMRGSKGSWGGAVDLDASSVYSENLSITTCNTSVNYNHQQQQQQQQQQQSSTQASGLTPTRSVSPQRPAAAAAQVSAPASNAHTPPAAHAGSGSNSASRSAQQHAWLRARDKQLFDDAALALQGAQEVLARGSGVGGSRAGATSSGSRQSRVSTVAANLSPLPTGAIEDRDMVGPVDGKAVGDASISSRSTPLATNSASSGTGAVESSVRSGAAYLHPNSSPPASLRTAAPSAKPAAAAPQAASAGTDLGESAGDTTPDPIPRSAPLEPDSAGPGASVSIQDVHRQEAAAPLTEQQLHSLRPAPTLAGLGQRPHSASSGFMRSTISSGARRVGGQPAVAPRSAATSMNVPEAHHVQYYARQPAHLRPRPRSANGRMMRSLTHNRRIAESTSGDSGDDYPDNDNDHRILDSGTAILCMSPALRSRSNSAGRMSVGGFSCSMTTAGATAGSAARPAVNTIHDALYEQRKSHEQVLAEAARRHTPVHTHQPTLYSSAAHRSGGGGTPGGPGTGNREQFFQRLYDHRTVKSELQMEQFRILRAQELGRNPDLQCSYNNYHIKAMRDGAAVGMDAGAAVGVSTSWDRGESQDGASNDGGSGGVGALGRSMAGVHVPTGVMNPEQVHSMVNRLGVEDVRSREFVKATDLREEERRRQLAHPMVHTNRRSEIMTKKARRAALKEIFDCLCYTVDMVNEGVVETKDDAGGASGSGSDGEGEGEGGKPRRVASAPLFYGKEKHNPAFNSIARPPSADGVRASSSSSASSTYSRSGSTTPTNVPRQYALKVPVPLRRMASPTGASTAPNGSASASAGKILDTRRARADLLSDSVTGGVIGELLSVVSENMPQLSLQQFTVLVEGVIESGTAPPLNMLLGVPVKGAHRSYSKQRQLTTEEQRAKEFTGKPELLARRKSEQLVARRYASAERRRGAGAGDANDAPTQRMDNEQQDQEQEFAAKDPVLFRLQKHNESKARTKAELEEADWQKYASTCTFEPFLLSSAPRRVQATYRRSEKAVSERRRGLVSLSEASSTAVTGMGPGTGSRPLTKARSRPQDENVGRTGCNASVPEPLPATQVAAAYINSRPPLTTSVAQYSSYQPYSKASKGQGQGNEGGGITVTEMSSLPTANAAPASKPELQQRHREGDVHSNYATQKLQQYRQQQLQQHQQQEAEAEREEQLYEQRQQQRSRQHQQQYAARKEQQNQPNHNQQHQHQHQHQQEVPHRYGSSYSEMFLQKYRSSQRPGLAHDANSGAQTFDYLYDSSMERRGHGQGTRLGRSSRQEQEQEQEPILDAYQLQEQHDHEVYL